MYAFFITVSFRLLLPKILLPKTSLGRVGRPGSLSILALLLLFCLFPLATATTASAVDGEFTYTGEIIVVLPDSSMVAVEVIDGNRPRIVGARLAPDAILRKEGAISDLRDFSVGEKVKVTWREQNDQKEIIALISFGLPYRMGQMPPTAPIGEPQAPQQPQEPQEPLKIPDTSKYKASPMRQVPVNAIIGSLEYHVVGSEETLLDIARDYKLGYNEVIDLYPDMDPWLPPVGKRLLLPTAHVLPDSVGKGIVINVPEMRLYYFKKKGKDSTVVTYPIGIGDTDFQTPPGNYTVGNKRVNPTWYIPPSLLAKYKVKSIPPGPDNPLGKYWISLAGTMYGIHGSDIPWSIGRKVTHGCIRMYPEDIEVFFAAIPTGTRVQIVYEPVKIAQVGDKVFLEVHNDIYGKFPDLAAHAQQKAMEKGVWELVNQQRFMAVVQSRKGIPENVTGGSGLAVDTDF